MKTDDLALLFIAASLLLLGAAAVLAAWKVPAVSRKKAKRPTAPTPTVV